MMATWKNSFLRDRAGAAALALCVLGALISAYLLVADFLLGGAEFCLTGQGCDVVRESRYSRMGGIPVPLLGVLGYAAMAAAVLSPLGAQDEMEPSFSALSSRRGLFSLPHLP